MATHYSPKIVTDGLVLCLDAADENSYPGEPTTNLAQTAYTLQGVHGITLSYIGVEDGWEKYSLSGTWAVDDTYPYSMGVRAATVSFTGGLPYTTRTTIKTNVPSKFNTFGAGINYVNQPMDASGTNSSVLNSDGSVTAQRKGFIYTSTTSQIGYLHTRGVSTGTTFNSSTDFVWCRHTQIEQNSHPTQYLAPGATRSATDGWKDLTGNGNHGDLTNMTFDSDAQMDFDGSSGYISFSSTDYGIAAEWTVSWWMNMDDDGLQTFFSMKEAGSNNKIEFITNNTIREIFANLLDHDGTVIQVDTDNTVWSTGEWTHVAITNNGGTATSSAISFYINGEAKSNNVVNGATITPMEAGSRTLSIGKEDGGSRYVDGKITAVHVYNCALSAKEVSQNFNAKRSRFGV